MSALHSNRDGETFCAVSEKQPKLQYLDFYRDVMTKFVPVSMHHATNSYDRLEI
jgi:hypothetical protein